MPDIPLFCLARHAKEQEHQQEDAAATWNVARFFCEGKAHDR